MARLICLIVLTTAVTAQVTARCPSVCECPAEPLVCPPGVSRVPDGCGCCKVCAAQLNQDCSLMKPCDHYKGLKCNYGNDITITWGICRAKSEGRTCEYNSKVYQNGESFHVGCKHQCTCINGAVGCTPLCANQVPLATPSCPYPRLIRIPGQCCFSMDCHKGILHLPPKHKPLPQYHQPENDLLPASRLVEIKSSSWNSKHGNKHLHAWNHLKEKKCPIQTSDWSRCSRSCGMGVSSRITNNPECKLMRETRICTIRPCSGFMVPVKKGKMCSPTQKALKPIKLSYGECWSVRLYWPKYCSVCTDGRCCSPHRTRTLPVTFLCADGERLRKLAMFIQSCKCRDDCGHLNEVALPQQHWKYGDIHKFID
ncbi:CCN family member 1-like [Thalassophryne amazonica]|uniref:CCN family member 1-like n=1 Tax=Thalassophryne amazonica TaxID=390379 RepID=UPI001470D8B5|nr:CCN family member 1-like [Thalassophryne amazonica]